MIASSNARITDIIPDITPSPICIFEDCCEILQKNNVSPAYNIDEIKRIYRAYTAEITLLGGLITARSYLHWWQYTKLREANRNISKSIAHVTTYSKWYGHIEERLMMQVEIIDRNRITFTSMGEFREYYLPNMCKEERKPKGIIIILPRPSV